MFQVVEFLLSFGGIASSLNSMKHHQCQREVAFYFCLRLTSSLVPSELQTSPKLQHWEFFKSCIPFNVYVNNNSKGVVICVLMVCLDWEWILWHNEYIKNLRYFWNSIYELWTLHHIWVQFKEGIKCKSKGCIRVHFCQLSFVETCTWIKTIFMNLQHFF